MKILFVISEVEDIIKTGGLADVGKSLPLALKALGHEVCIILPYYKAVAENFDLVNAMPTQVMRIGHQTYNYDVKELDFHGIKTYLIDHTYFTDSDTPYGNDHRASNAQKFSFFSAASLCVSANINFAPDILHANDWHTAMTPYFINSNFLTRHNLIADHDFFAHTKSVITLHNAAFQGVESLHNVPILDDEDAGRVNSDNHHLNMLKTGIFYSHKVCPVSPTYAREISSYLGSHGVADVINIAPHKVVGVLNGCDYTQWDPATDQTLPANYSLEDLSGKAVCKSELQKQAGLPQLEKTPVIGMVCRATRQKGFAFLMPIIEQLLQHNVQLIIMGTGEESIVAELRELSSDYPNQVSFLEAFKPDYAHLIEAGSDFFLMPSEFEPCGLNQMYSLAYGTIPIVRKVGGLADTVIDFSLANSNGFAFEEPSAAALLSTLRVALLSYHECSDTFSQMIERGMQTRFTWENAAKEYEKVYLS